MSAALINQDWNWKVFLRVVYSVNSVSTGKVKGVCKQVYKLFTKSTLTLTQLMVKNRDKIFLMDQS